MSIIFDGDKSLIYDADTYAIKVLGSSNNLIFVDGNVTGPWGKPWLKQKWIDFYTTRKSNANVMLLAFERVIKACSLLAEPVKASGDLNEQRSRSEVISNKEDEKAKGPKEEKLRPALPERYEYTYYTLKPDFSIKLRKSNSFLRVQIFIMTQYDSRVIKNINKHNDEIRKAVVETIGSVTRQDIDRPNYRSDLAKSLLKVVNEILASHEGFGGIEEVNFSEFLVK
jgi:hypothetical protein